MRCLSAQNFASMVCFLEGDKIIPPLVSYLRCAFMDPRVLINVPRENLIWRYGLFLMDVSGDLQ